MIAIIETGVFGNILILNGSLYSVLHIETCIIFNHFIALDLIRQYEIK